MIVVGIYVSLCVSVCQSFQSFQSATPATRATLSRPLSHLFMAVVGLELGTRTRQGLSAAVNRVAKAGVAGGDGGEWHVKSSLTARGRGRSRVPHGSPLFLHSLSGIPHGSHPSPRANSNNVAGR